MSHDHTTAEAFGRLAVELHDVESVEETVEAVVQFALHAVPCTSASIVMIERRRPEVVAVTDTRLTDLYQRQIAGGHGPMITAIAEGEAVSITDVASETRWSPEWAAEVLATGIRSALHLPLTVSGRPAAVLSLYGEVAGGFGVDEVAIAHILARHATVAIATARREANLNRAVDARKLVGQAMGILMERYDLDSDRAFEVLRRYSQDTNRKLRDVAQELIDTRKLPGAGQDRPV
ncbi:GAF and ANTAR domain-containing protein [Kribbella sp. NPDC020789]